MLDNDPAVRWEFSPNRRGNHARGPCPLRCGLCQCAARYAREFRRRGRATRLIARHGVGYDSVDVAACTEHGVALTIQPDGVRRPVAVAALTYVMALSQKLFIKDRLTRPGGGRRRTTTWAWGLSGARWA